MKISVVTPSVRPDMLEIVEKCLKRQSFKDWEWIVISPFEYKNAIWIADPPKKNNEFYKLNAAWNLGFKQAKGELVLSLVDGIYIEPDTLERFWHHYQDNPKSCVSGIGHQYKRLENGKPEICIWKDPRVRFDFGSFYEIFPIDLELVCTSLPFEGIKAVGGIDEDFDRVPALSEKDLAIRMDMIGYKPFIDQSIEYRALYHPRLTEDWDKKYKEESIPLFHKKQADLQNGTRSVNVGLL